MATAAKRLSPPDGSPSASGHDLGHHAPTEKRLRTATRFSTVVVEVWKRSRLEKLCSAMEPVIRKAVKEEFKRRLDHHNVMAGCHLGRSPSVQLCAPKPPPPPLPVNISLHLVFPKTLKQPIFTMNRIVSGDVSPVQVLVTPPILADSNMITTAIPLSALPFPVKLEIVVLDGDFPGADGTWTVEDFEDGIVKARDGKRPLLAGDFTVTLWPGGGELALASFGDLQITDNSSWVRSRKFRLGARVITRSHGSSVRIREAVTEAFIVRDHRGESYKKHYPPKLEDEVWRLEKIRRGGNLNKNLASAGVKTVRDFLTMSIIEPQRLQSMMGSEKNWKASLKHAKTCEIFGDSLVLEHPICHVASANVDGQIYTDTASLLQKGCINDAIW